MAEIKKSSHKNAARSRYLIKQAFAQLMNEKDIQKITVTDVVERANISRGTFYAHYLDVYDLCVAIQNNVLETVDSAINEIGVLNILQNPTEVTLAGMKYLEANKSYFKLFIMSSYADKFTDRIVSRLDYRLYEAASEVYPSVTHRELSLFIKCALGAYKNIIMSWFDDDKSFSAEECAEYLSAFYLRSRPDFLASIPTAD